MKNIEFHKVGENKFPVYEYILDTKLVNNESDRINIFNYIEELRVGDLSQMLKSRHVKKLDDICSLYELRPLPYRIFFRKKLDYYYLLHIINKKSDKIPKHDLKKAKQLAKMYN